MRHPEGGDHHIRGAGDELAWGDYKNSAEDNASPLHTQLWNVLKRLIWLKPLAEDDLDLIVTRPQKHVDGLTKWAVWYLIPFYECEREHRIQKWEAKKALEAQQDLEKQTKAQALNLGGKVKKGETVETWSETTVVRMKSGVATVVACLLPVVAITYSRNSTGPGICSSVLLGLLSSSRLVSSSLLKGRARESRSSQRLQRKSPVYIK